MSNDGFARADIDTSYFDDDKVKALWRIVQPDHDAMSVAVMLHVALVLGSWRAGRRLTVDEAAPAWIIPPSDIVAALVTVGLLDRQRRLPARPWAEWFEPAMARRGQARAAGKIGNQKRWGARMDAEVGGAIADAMALRVAPQSRGESRRDPQPSIQPSIQPSNQPPDQPSRKGTSNARPRASRGAARGLTSLGDAIAGTPFAAEHDRRRAES